MELARKVQLELGLSVTRVETKRFPDGEKYLRVLDDVSGDDVVVIHSMFRSPDELLVEYLLLVDTLKDIGARRVVSFIPYFPYARQDTRFNPGEALSPATISKLIEAVGTDELFAFDTQLHRIQGMKNLFKIPAHNLTAVPAVVRYLRQNVALDKPVVIGPDQGSEALVKVAAKDLGDAESEVLTKKRISAEKVEISAVALNVRGKDVLILDDIISTGNTVTEALKMILRHGARRAVVACIHPILAGDSLSRIRAAGAEGVIATDTVPSPVSVVSVSSIIADEIRRLR